jgi:ATP-binding protein involved in chromosome partitioning
MAGPVSDSAILDALRPIVDPDFGKSIVDLGFVKNLQIDGSDVSFAIELTTPACPVCFPSEEVGQLSGLV